MSGGNNPAAVLTSATPKTSAWSKIKQVFSFQNLAHFAAKTHEDIVKYGPGIIKYTSEAGALASAIYPPAAGIARLSSFAVGKLVAAVEHVDDAAAQAAATGNVRLVIDVGEQEYAALQEAYSFIKVHANAQGLGDLPNPVPAPLPGTAPAPATAPATQAAPAPGA